MSATLSGWSPGAGTIDVGAVYERHAPEIHDFLVRTVRDHATAEDLTQTTFIRLLERGDSVREMEKVRPWLFTVAHNLAVTHVTRRRPTDPIEAAFEIASGEKGPEDEALAIAAAALVWDAASSLEPRQYAVLDLSVRRGFSVAEIAEVLEITPAHAAVVVHRAREALAQAIRLLVVVRQRLHCARLAEIVPPGTDLLTPDLRASVDRHMRRCENCKEVGARLTEPAELLGVIPLIPLPLALQHMPLMPHHAVPLHQAAQHMVQKAAHTLMQPVALATVAAVAIVGGGLGLMLSHGGAAPQAVADTSRPHGAGATLPGGSHGVPQGVPGLPPGGVVDLQPLGPGGGGDGGASGAGSSAPGGSGTTPWGSDNVVEFPLPPHSGPSSPTPPPPPLLDLQLPPPLLGPLPVGVHIVVPQPPGQPTVTVTPGPGQASHR